MALVPPSAGSRRNIPSALDHPDQYLQKEVDEQRVAGPFPIYACVGHVSRFGVIPKNHQPNKWRLIFYLSHPKGYSVNDDIPKELCSMSYITTDDAVRKIVQLGPGSLLHQKCIPNYPGTPSRQASSCHVVEGLSLH